MAKYRYVYTSFWNDPRVVEEMTAEDKYFFLYLLTNESTTQIGIYQITKKQMAFDLGYSIESIGALLQRFITHHKLIKYNEKTRELAIKNWAKYNLQKGGKPILDCIRKELSQVKDISLIHYVGEQVERNEIKELYDSYYDSLDDTSTIRVEIEEFSNDGCSYDTSTIRGQKEKEEEKEKQKEKQKEEEKEEEKETSSSSFSSSLINDCFVKIRTFFDENIRISTFAEHKKIFDLLDRFNDPLLIIEAIKLSVERGAAHLGYAEGILNNWKTEYGIVTYEDWKVKKGAKSQGNNNQQPIRGNHGKNESSLDEFYQQLERDKQAWGG